MADFNISGFVLPSEPQTTPELESLARNYTEWLPMDYAGKEIYLIRCIDDRCRESPETVRAVPLIHADIGNEGLKEAATQVLETCGIVAKKSFRERCQLNICILELGERRIVVATLLAKGKDVALPYVVSSRKCGSVDLPYIPEGPAKVTMDLRR